MMTLFIHYFIKGHQQLSDPDVKRAYAVLSSTVGIILNLFLCAAKVGIGYLSHSIAITADGFNNLSDAGTSLVSLIGFKIAGYGSGNVHPFGHGRIEWIMGIFTSIAILLMGIKLIDTSFAAIAAPDKPVFSTALVLVLMLSIMVKGYMYSYNRKIARITDSETLKATAADCISDAVSTFAVLASSIISYVTKWQADGYCSMLVSMFILVTGAKSLWEVLGRIMGKAANQDIMDTVLQCAKEHPDIAAIQNLMIHDYGFGYFVASMRAEGYRRDGELLYASIHDISCVLYKEFHCDCFIQIDYLVENPQLEQMLETRIRSILQGYSGKLSIDHLRLIENGPASNIAFDLLYPAELQKNEAEIRRAVEQDLESQEPQYHVVIKSIIRRQRIRLPRLYKNKNCKEDLK